MTQKLWTAVDDYIAQRLGSSDSVLDEVSSACAAAGLPPISVSPSQGKLLSILAAAQGARSILEIGTLGGYSTIWLARSLPPDGCLISLELDARHAEVARANIARAGFAGIVDVRVGAALDTLAQLPSETRFDMTFIDADKELLAEYFEWAMKFSRRGSLIIADNVVRNGDILDETSADPRVVGVRRFYEMLAADQRVDATAIQTVGIKGYDGFAMIRVAVAPEP